MTKEETRQFLDGVMEEQALVVGGLVTLYAVDDTFIRRLFRSLTAIRKTALDRLDGRDDGSTPEQPRASTEPHPAIEQFLRGLGRG